MIFQRELEVSFTTLMASLIYLLYLEVEIAEFVDKLSAEKNIDRGK